MLKISRLSMSYGSGSQLKVIFRDLDCSVEKGEVICLVGPSGVGKSTLMRCIAGLSKPVAGKVELDGTLVDRPLRDVCLVFQDYSRSLMPWLKVIGNVTLPLLNRIASKQERLAAAHAAIEAVGLRGNEDKYPWQLSGGMQQRVAIARAIACKPRLLLMDEPFASVDAQTRADLEDLTLRLRDQFGMSVLVVTHDIDESVYMSDRVVVLRGSPAEVVETIDIPLPVPRDQISTKTEPRFAQLRAHILRQIRGETEPQKTSGRVGSVAGSAELNVVRASSITAIPDHIQSQA
ncbi:ABC transporter ATP-binding protein [Labrys sp. KB_33_2]|uniref:ABC transporter ATP-binding protein n=1 Tax=Labrys sp. KB_33_2 TaxID=3237479 RepID=UPI003F8F429F